MSTEWYYARNDQQLGPISANQLKQLAASGQLAPTDLVWKDGMAEWSPASKIKGLFDPATTTAATAPVPTPTAAAPTQQYVAQPKQFVPPQQPAQPQQAGAQIAYYNPTGTASILRGFPTPTGPANEWPLDRHHLNQLKETEKHRKIIRNCSALFNFLFVVYLIISIFAMIGGAAILSYAPMPRGGPAGAAATWAQGVMIAVCVVLVGLTLLAFFASRATLKCRMWAPVVWLVLFILNALWIVFSTFMAMSSTSSDSTELIGPIFALVILAAFLWITIRAIVAIPRFLGSPVWCQEALVNAKL